MTRLLPGAALFLCAAASAHAQGYATNFDSGSAGWTLDPPVNGAGWAADSTPATFPNGVSRSGLSLNFNNGTDYAGCTAGGALSPALPLAGLANPVLEFWCNYDTETRGTRYDRRTLQIWDGYLTVKFAEWPLASVGYAFDPAGGLLGAGPGPCSESYNDIETGAPVSTWHRHRIFLDPAWGTIRIRFLFWSVDDLRNGYAGWAIDDFSVASHPTPPAAGWPDLRPDTTTGAGDITELDLCERRPGDTLAWSWGTTVAGSVGVHLIVGDHDQSILDRSFMFFDPAHNHWHLSQFSDFSLWQTQTFGFQKVRRGPKRSFCLADVQRVIAGTTSISPGCGAAYEAISYGWQDIYPIGTSGQAIDVAGLATNTDYYLVGNLDPINRLREVDESNQTDQIHFTLPPTVTTNTQVSILDRMNPFPPTATALAIAAASVGTFQGNPAVQVLGTGFDTTLVPVLYDAATAVAEAPFFTIVSATEIWVDVPAGITTPASIDLLRPRGDAASFRIGGPAGTPCAPPADPPPLAGGGNGHRCGVTGLEILALLGLAALLRRRAPVA